MAESVTLNAGEKPRYFQFGSPLSNVASANGNSPAIYKEAVYSTFQGIVNGTGAVTATFTLQVTNSDKTAQGVRVGVQTTNTSTTVTSGALFNGFVDPVSSAWIPPVQVGDTISGPGIPAAATVTAIASASSLTISAAATASGNVIATFQDANWVATNLGVITLSGTNSATDGFTTSAAWRWVRAVLTNLTGTSALAQALMVR